MAETPAQKQEKVMNLLEQAKQNFEKELGGLKKLKMEHLQNVINAQMATVAAYEERYEALEKDLCDSKETKVKADMEKEAAQNVCDLFKSMTGSRSK